jgi:hypothetical protein
MDSLMSVSGFVAEHWQWLGLGMSLAVLVLAVLILSRMRVVQSRPLTTCTVLSLIAHGLIVTAICLGKWFDMPVLPRGIPICMRLADPSMEEVEDFSLPTEPPTPDAHELDVIFEHTNSDPIQAAALPEIPEKAPPTEDQALDPSDGAPVLAVEPALELTDTVPTGEMEPKTAAQAPDPPEDSREISDDPSLQSSTDTAGGTDELTPGGNVLEPVHEDGPEPSDSMALLADLDEPENEPSDGLTTPSEPGAESSPAVDDEPESGWRPVSDGIVATAPLSADRSTQQPDRTLFQHSRLAHRANTRRVELLGAYGGSEVTELAVRDALAWLVKAQLQDGRWSARQHGAGQGGFVEGQARDGVGISADTGITGLALLAFLGAGYTNADPRFGQVVQAGVDYLRHTQSPQGSLAGDADHFARTYCHGIATLALGEYVSLTDDLACKDTLQRSVAATLRAQHQVTGGWRYQPGDEGDTSQFGWQVMALSSAQNAGISIPSVQLVRARGFLQIVSSGAHGGLAAYRRQQMPTPPMTAEALVCRLLLNDASREEIDEATQFILQHPPRGGLPNFYYNYYGSLALHLSNADWSRWNASMQRELLACQVKHGSLAGSWDTSTVWGRCGGRVYTTALGALCLEVYYRYLPVIQREMARR